MMMRRVLLVFLLLGCFRNASAQSKWAFVVGVDDYQNLTPLEHAISDADKIFRALRDSGFGVTYVKNPKSQELHASWKSFVSLVKAADVAVVYFAGHGVQQDGVNFLLPRDFDQKADGLTVAARPDRWLTELAAKRPALKIFILDACRNSPFSGGSNGLASMENPAFGAGTYIMYATSPGRVARDELFARNLAREMRRPGNLLPDVFGATAAAVQTESAGAQTPFQISTGAIPRFYFSNPDRVRPLDDAAAGRCREAMPALETLVSLEPNDGLLWMALAGCQAGNGDLALARRSLERARELVDHKEMADTVLARIALEDGDTFEARQHLENALLESPNHAPALVLQGRIFMKERKYRDAVDIFEKIYERIGSRESCDLFVEALRLDGATTTAERQQSRCSLAR